MTILLPILDNFERSIKANNYADEDGPVLIYKQLKSLLPARVDSQTGILIEPNILERSKQIIGDRPEFDNRYY